MATFTTSDGLNLHYTDEGAGLPLLCLAGLTRTGGDFDYARPHLPPCRVITLDYRGRGQSDWDPDWRNYTLPVEIRDVMELMDHLGLPRVAILGTSRGGLNAMGLAATAPDRLIGAALNDIGPELESAGMAAVMDYLGKPPLLGTHAAMAAAMAVSLPGFANVPPERWMAEAQLHYRQTDAGLEITYDPHLRDAIEAGGDVPDLWPFFDALAGKPTCLIRGAGSNLLSAETAQRMQDRHPGMIHAEVPDRGHVPFLDEPEAVAALATWMEQLA
ncbi:alpha/beta hydrolase [uncultured Tateyamaria sp.]|uniref:alpha/beta fold hydrolase n=1 Tax=Tateyamaria sp. 1078 TaxID=3417464 RepID=UPI002625CE69|nr:alpha/beta hydrolase [uncultured Tateyamaria sp.]